MKKQKEAKVYIQLPDEVNKFVDVMADAIKSGVLNPNEIRAVMKLDPIEGGDVNMVLTSTGWVPLAELEKYYAELPADAVMGTSDS